MVYYGHGNCKEKGKYGTDNYPGRIGKDGCLALCKNDPMCTFVTFGGKDTNGPICWKFNSVACNLEYAKTKSNLYQSLLTYKKIKTGITIKSKYNYLTPLPLFQSSLYRKHSYHHIIFI